MSGAAAKAMNRANLVQAIRLVSTEGFSRSSGPGGQNVNKVNTQVTLRVPLEALLTALKEPASDIITAGQAATARERLRPRANETGELVIQVSDTRSQLRNREIAVERAADLVESSLKPVRKRRRTRPSVAAKERRLESKRRRSQVKRDRGRVQE